MVSVEPIFFFFSAFDNFFFFFFFFSQKGQDGSKLEQKNKSAFASLLTRRSSEPPTTNATAHNEYTSTSRNVNDSPVLGLRSNIASLGSRLKAAGSLATMKISSSAASLSSGSGNSIAKSHRIDPLQPIFLLSSLQLFAESAGALALRVASSQHAIETSVVKLSVVCATRVNDLAMALQRVHFLQVNAAVVDSLYRETSAATRSLELLFNQTVQLDQQMNALLEGRWSDSADQVDGARALAASLAPRAPMWTQYESVHSLYVTNDAAAKEVQRTWGELIPQWPANKGFVWVRQLWARGVPPEFRAIVWCDAIGNDVMVTQSEYALYCELIEAKVVDERNTRAAHHAAYRRLVETEQSKAGAPDASRAPAPAAATPAVDAIASELRMVSVDVPRTFGELQIFGDGTAIPSDLNPAASKLRRVVLAASLRPGSPGYCQGMTHIAAMLLLYMDEFDAYMCLVNLLERHFFHSLFAMDIEQLQRHLSLYDAFFAVRLPDVYAHLRSLGVLTSAYALDWFMTLFGKALEHRCCARVIDMFLLEGESFLFRVALAILTLQRRRLLGAEIENVSRILKDTPFLDEKLIFDTIDESVAVSPDIAEAVEKLEAEEKLRRRRARREATLASIDALKTD
jgi:hypothetical protein